MKDSPWDCSCSDLPPYALKVRHLLDIAGEVVEALRAHEEPFGDLRQPRQPEGLGQPRTVGEGRAMMVAIAALGIEPAAFRQGFEQRRFSAAVFTDKKRDRAAKGQVDSVSEGGDVERIPSGIEFLRQALYVVKERCSRGPCRPCCLPSRFHSSHYAMRGLEAKAALRPAINTQSLTCRKFLRPEHWFRSSARLLRREWP